MQQTTKYQFNLVENTDDFSPAPLNQNMEKVEEELEGIEESLADVVSGLGTGGHNARVAYGSYTGTGTNGASSPNTLSFDFYPLVVIIQGVGMQTNGILVRGSNMGTSTWSGGGGPLTAAWTNSSVSWYSADGASFQNNISGITYFYAAVGYAQ